ncbi:MAG: RHS repeat protein, partial [Chromatiaceae bacterium]|nr:RHS repeat protein [Chromatiaceae bacterium]
MYGSVTDRFERFTTKAPGFAGGYLLKQSGGPSIILADNINYHPFGPVASLDYGNGISLTQTLDDGYRLKDILVPGVINISNMLYDANGNLSERTHDTAPELFSYDAINRLDGSDGALGVRVFSYDSNGNRIQLTEDSSTTSYGYDAGNNRLSSIGANNVQTDDNGNTIIKGNWTFSYTSDNRLENVHNGSTLVASYFYNGLGQRSSKAIMADQSSAHYGYGRDGSLLVEQDDQGNVNKEYVYLDSSLIAVLESSISTSSQLS